MGIIYMFGLVRLLGYGCAFTRTVKGVPPRGKLMVVATPIGNMEDISPNMLRALLTADLIACEDRRVAGHLYSLIRNRNILQQVNERFGDIGLTALVTTDGVEGTDKTERQHQFYNYAGMKDKERRKFLRSMSQAQQEAFKQDFLKYRALKVLGRYGQGGASSSREERVDELYGIDLSDMRHIQAQMARCRREKGRGVLIPLNTYSETKAFDLVRALLESRTVALVSDAGMPCISDPGWKLVDKVRTSMPELPVEVVGGPSSVGVMALQASLGAKRQGLSGRFQGFSGLATGNFQQKSQQVRQMKTEEFSIHFINANKLKKRLLQLQQVFSGQHRILLANELTKKYERRYNGTIGGLIEKLSNNDDFEPVGEVSYLVYPDGPAESSLPLIEKEKQKQEGGIDVGTMSSTDISMKKFLSSLDKHCPDMGPKEKCSLLCSIFGIKQGEARKHVYAKFSAASD